MSHTATGEWKSFEIRMRRRRAERLIMRAQVAADEGCLEAARASLDEARALWPGVPGLAETQQKIESVGAVAASAAAPSRWKEIIAGGAALMFVVAAVTLLAVMRRENTRGEVPLPAHDVKATVEAAIDGAGVTPPAEPMPQPAPPLTATPDPKNLTPVADLLPPVSDVRRPISDLRSPASDVAPSIPDLRPPVADVRPPASDPRPAIPDLPAASNAVVPASDPTVVQPPQEPLVRAVLARYAKAYSTLDADAVARVWPSVNPSALERAFDSLQTQRVSLGDCRIQIDGSAAHASCAGSARWAPKVGGGERTDERIWTFDLEKSADGWQITNARVQNR